MDTQDSSQGNQGNVEQQTPPMRSIADVAGADLVNEARKQRLAEIARSEQEEAARQAARREKERAEHLKQVQHFDAALQKSLGLRLPEGWDKTAYVVMAGETSIALTYNPYDTKIHMAGRCPDCGKPSEWRWVVNRPSDIAAGMEIPAYSQVLCSACEARKREEEIARRRAQFEAEDEEEQQKAEEAHKPLAVVDNRQLRELSLAAYRARQTDTRAEDSANFRALVREKLHVDPGELILPEIYFPGRGEADQTADRALVLVKGDYYRHLGVRSSCRVCQAPVTSVVSSMDALGRMLSVPTYCELHGSGEKEYSPEQQLLAALKRYVDNLIPMGIEA